MTAHLCPPVLAVTDTGQGFLDRVRHLSDPAATPTADLELALTAAADRAHAPQWMTVTTEQHTGTSQTAPGQRRLGHHA